MFNPGSSVISNLIIAIEVLETFASHLKLKKDNHTSRIQYFPPFFFFKTSSALGSKPGAMIPSET